MNSLEIKTKLKIFIKDNFLLGFGPEDVNDDDSFMEKGIIDSTGILELISFIEETFSIKIKDEELVPDNLDSINKLVTFLDSKIK